MKKLQPHIKHVVALSVLLASSTSFAQESVSEDDDVRPSPPSIGADVPVTYFGPPPSTVEPELIGPLAFLKGIDDGRSGDDRLAPGFDEDAGTITLPLYQGQLRDNGEKVWYIFTDTTDESAARIQGINHSAKLRYTEDCRAVRTAEYVSGTLVFDFGRVNFAPEHSVVPGNAQDPVAPAYPPLSVQPGSVGDALYSPLVNITNAGGHIYNAPMVAFNVDAEQLNFCDGNVDYNLVHDSVTRICPSEGTVTLRLTSGFSTSRPVLYLSTDASDPLPAAMGRATYAPGLRDVPAGNQGGAFSAVERLYSFSNGQVNPANSDVSNPQRQGLNSAILDDASPLNILSDIPTFGIQYSPLWDVSIGEWTQEAIARGYRARITEEFRALGFVERNFITGPNGQPFGSSGFIVNGSIVYRFL